MKCLEALKKLIYTINIVNKFTVPPTGLPNEGLRKKPNESLYTEKFAPPPKKKLFFLRAARSN